VSVVVPTYNRARLLRRCLASLERLDYPRDLLELIVVNDGSTDATGRVLSDYAARTSLHFTPVTQANSGPAAARNKGIAAAGGEFVAFTDDDCAVDAHWLRALVDGFADRRVCAGVGGVGGVMRTRARGLISSYLAVTNLASSNVTGDGYPPYLITANACFPRELLVDLGGFDEEFKAPGGEDSDLSWRMVARGYTLEIIPSAIVDHYQKTRLIDLLRTYHNYGKGDAFVERKHGMLADQTPAVSAGRVRVLQGMKVAIANQGILSPGHFIYKVKIYRNRHKQNWRRAILFALLDHVSRFARRQGYLYVKRTTDDRGNIKQ
jgi:glycosyltransferase involved in cell wall biosynthesis